MDNLWRHFKNSKSTPHAYLGQHQYTSKIAQSIRWPSPFQLMQAGVGEKVYQKLLSNRKPGHIDKVLAAHIIKPTSFRIYRKKYINLIFTSKGLQ